MTGVRRLVSGALTSLGAVASDVVSEFRQLTRGGPDAERRRSPERQSASLLERPVWSATRADAPSRTTGCALTPSLRPGPTCPPGGAARATGTTDATPTWGVRMEQQLVDAGARAAVGGRRAGAGGGPRVPRRRARRRLVRDARRHLAVRRRPGVLQEAGRARLAGHDLAEAVRRPRAVGDGALRRHRGAAGRRRAGRRALDRRPAVRAEPAAATAPRSSGRRSCRGSPRGSASSSSG